MSDELTRLKPQPGSTRDRTRVGRGEGAGKGRTAGRGQKGAGARAGASTRPGFEGGQVPLQRRLPKRGFRNIFAKEYTAINLSRVVHRFEAGSVIDAAVLRAMGVIPKVAKNGLKVLGDGEIDRPLIVRAARFTQAAAAKIEAAGGRAEVI